MNALSIGLSREQLDTVFPFHMVFNRDLAVIQAGSTIQRIVPGILEKRMPDFLILTRPPVLEVSFEGLRDASKHLFVLEIRDRKITLRGQMLVLDETRTVAFLGSPWLNQAASLRDAGLSLRDFALHDATIDLVHTLQAQKDALADSKRLSRLLESQRSDLASANEKLEEQNAQLKATEELNRRILETSPDSFIMTDSLGTITSFNRAAEEAFLYRAEEVTGKNVSILMPEPERSRHGEYIKAYQLTGHRHVIGTRREVVAQRSDGTTFPCELSVGEVKTQRETLFTGFVRDFTHWRRMQAELRESEARYRSVVEAVKEVVFQTDTGGRFLLLNPSWTELTGYTVAESLGKNFINYVHPENRERSLALFGPLIRREKESCRHEIRYLTKNGGFRWVEVFARLTLGPGGETTGTVGTLLDITERRHVEDELRRIKEAAEEAARLKSEFLANMSHEIRTPLNAVIGMSDLLFEGGLRDDQREYAETIRRSGKALLQLVNQVLDFSKIESGKLEIVTNPFNLSKCLEDAAGFVASLASGKGLELVLDARSSTATTYEGDENRIGQILTNLLSNAVKFTDTGEVVLTATVSRQPDGTGLMEASVRDTGIGIPRKGIERLFHPFSQVDSSSTRRFGGTGLGLVISRRLAETMGGTLTCESEEGRGSTFTLRLPLLFAPQRSGFLPRWSAPGPLEQILVVEDNDAQATAIMALLESLGLAAVREPSADSALERIKEGRSFSAVLADTTMKDMQSQDFVARVRSAMGEDAPILLLAPVGQRGQLARENLEGVEIVSKPVRARHLAEALERQALGSTTKIRKPTGRYDRPLLSKRFPLKILVVEDNAVNRRVISLLLKSLGYEASLVADGQAALDAVIQASYDVIFMDVQMPGMDGLEATREIRRLLPRDRQPYVIAMTAGAFRQERERCLAAGMDAFLAKPVQRADVEGMLEQAASDRDFGTRPMDGEPAPWKQAVVSALTDLARLLKDGGPEFAVGTVEMFLEETGEGIRNLQGAVTRGDAGTAKIIAHGLKGSCQSLRVENLAAIFLQIENLARSGHLSEGIPALVTLAHKEFEKTRAFLQSDVWRAALGT